jgi:hypothetical protein
MLRRVVLVRTDVWEELNASLIRVTSGISSQRASVASYSCVVPSSTIHVTLLMEVLSSSETSLLTRATRLNNTEDTILFEEVIFKILL